MRNLALRYFAVARHFGVNEPRGFAWPAELEREAAGGLTAAPPEVLILHGDRVYGEALQAMASEALPAARLRVERDREAAEASMHEMSGGLLITDVSLHEADLLDWLGTQIATHGARLRVVVTTSRREQRVVMALRTMVVDALFDPVAEAAGRFGHALRVVARGGVYWSGSMLGRLAECCAPDAIARVLTPAEQVALAAIGDGCDDTEGAALLGLKVSTVGSLRRALHRKLNVQHKGQLVRLAVQHGFVRFTPTGIVRPGFSLLVQAVGARR